MQIKWEQVLNEQQLKGVVSTEGPVLILAGAGSGKTRVLTHRIAYLIEEKNVLPYHIMAITFTNKAAKEMCERIERMIGEDAKDVWATTFHSSCVRILRRFADHLGYDRNFSIYDADDSKTVMKEACKKLNIDTKKYKEKYFLRIISSAKDELLSVDDFAKHVGNTPAEQLQVKVYEEYQKRLHSNNAFDFDDLIMKTVELLKTDAAVLEFYQKKFTYICVDEYQDTNTAQFELVRLLASGSRNLCVVGDDDQSIYKFRGANIYNIINFETHYLDALVIRLEQNYRSTKTILDAANHVIANNQGRKEKSLWTQNEQGEKVVFRSFDSAYEEAEFIARDIIKKVKKHDFSYRNCAVLYRTNAQSRIIEEKFLYENLPYKIVGGVNFYSRREIKDLLAYLKTIDNGSDDVAVKRIINVPKRGIGVTSITKVETYAMEHDMSFFDALCVADDIPSLKGAAAKMNSFVQFIMKMRSLAAEITVPEILKAVMEATGYISDLKAEKTDASETRLENIEELYAKSITFQNDSETKTLSAFLEEVALVAEIDNVSEDGEYVLLMTMHSAKGLEFPNVYLAGMEDGLFPSSMSIFSDHGDEEIEEERRLCYVAMTRAMNQLTLTSSRHRMIRGEFTEEKISRFVKEIPENLLDGQVWEEKSEFERTMSHHPEELERMAKTKDEVRRPTLAQTLNRNSNSSFGNGTIIQKKALDYQLGDRVVHQKFGEGIVDEIRDGGRDYEVTVHFDSAGVKKMFASFAKLQKI